MMLCKLDVCFCCYTNENIHNFAWHLMALLHGSYADEPLSAGCKKVRDLGLMRLREECSHRSGRFGLRDLEALQDFFKGLDVLVGIVSFGGVVADAVEPPSLKETAIDRLKADAVRGFV